MIHSPTWRECANSSDVGGVALSVSMGTWRLVRAGPGLSVWIGGEKTDVGGLTSAHPQLLTSRVFGMWEPRRIPVTENPVSQDLAPAPYLRAFCPLISDAGIVAGRNQMLKTHKPERNTRLPAN